MFWARFLEFWTTVCKVICTFVGGVGVGTILIILIYGFIELVPFGYMDDYLDDRRVAKKQRCWSFRGLWCLRHLVLAPLAYLMFAAFWYGFHGNWLGWIAGAAIVVMAWWLKDNLFVQLAH